MKNRGRIFTGVENSLFLPRKMEDRVLVYDKLIQAYLSVSHRMCSYNMGA
jgi:hypothetical protein